jgi:hypothetical protein|tara:strand:+ start:1157 stop:1648 length:492 start_codon:yes stop_codon:yes gene_type:complete
MPDHSLDDIVHSIQSAVVAATDMAERHELDSIMNQEFWELKVDEEGNPVKDESGRDVYSPKMVTMEIPMWEDGVLTKKNIPVPLQSLTTGQSLRVDKLEVEMSVEISGLESGKKKGRLMVRPCPNTSWFQKESNTAKLKLTFKGSEPPEGYARIDDQLIKLLP